MLKALVIGALAFVLVGSVEAAAIRDLPGCHANALPRCDDCSSGFAPFGFSLGFECGGNTGAYVNNNGNLTFTAPSGTYGPLDLSSTTLPIIAPFLADVDTQPAASGSVEFGTDTVGGHPAFCALWSGTGVGYYLFHHDKVNKFQVLLIDRSDVAPGDFDVEFNYDQVQWEAGNASGGVAGLGGRSARVGYSNGTGRPGTSFQQAGSGINGALLDSNPTGLVNDTNVGVPGRYVYHFAAAGCQEGPFGDPTCTDSDDNDGDTLVDEDDPNCLPHHEGPPGDITCVDLFDNDGDGFVDAADRGCQADPPEVCNGFDDDEDGDVDEGFPDRDGDGIADCIDQDLDDDGVLNGADNCPTIFNPDQTDDDATGIGDACEGNAGIVNGPSAVGIWVDGQFEPVAGEWGDVTPAVFLNGAVKVYTALDFGLDAIYLLYDNSLSTAPLANGDEIGPVSFQVGNNSFFDVYIAQGGLDTNFGPHPVTSMGGAGDWVRVVLNGEPFDNSAGCVVGAVDFNTTSPNFPGVPHNVAELEVHLTGGGDCYSPEPAFWSATLPDVTATSALFGRAVSSPSTRSLTVSSSFVNVDIATGVSTITPVVVCGDGTASPPEQCDDGPANGTPGSCCTASCTFVASATPCSDGNACTQTDQCNSTGTCVGTVPLVCDPCDACDPSGGCVAALAPMVCKQPIDPGRASLAMKDSASDILDGLSWKWGDGAATSLLDFGNPASGTTDYTLCVYDRPGNVLRRRYSGSVPHGGTCNGKPCWTSNTKGYKYADAALANSGIQKIQLQIGGPGHAKVSVKGKGANLGLVSTGTLPLSPKVTVQLRASDGACWGADYSTSTSNGATAYKAKSD